MRRWVGKALETGSHYTRARRMRFVQVGKNKMDKKALKLLHFMHLFASRFSITCDMLMSMLTIIGNGGFCTKEVSAAASTWSKYGGDRGQAHCRYPCDACICACV